MARKITMFELHFDGARFGPTFPGEADEADETVDDEDTADETPAETGGSRARRAVAAVGVLAVTTAVVGVAARRFRSTDDEMEDFAVEADAETEDAVTR